MNEIKKAFEEFALKQCAEHHQDSNYMGLIYSLWDDWIEQKLTEAKIEVLRKVYVGIYTKDEIPNIISELEKK